MDKVNQSRKPAADEVFELMHDVMHLQRGQRLRAFSAGGHALAHMEAKALGFFARHPGATLSDLAAHSGRDKSQLARLVGGLRERGLLQAEVDPGDRRNQRLMLTEAARGLHADLRARGQRAARAALEGLSAAECATLAALLERVRDNLRARADED